MYIKMVTSASCCTIQTHNEMFAKEAKEVVMALVMIGHLHPALILLNGKDSATHPV